MIARNTTIRENPWPGFSERSESTGTDFSIVICATRKQCAKNYRLINRGVSRSQHDFSHLVVEQIRHSLKSGQKFLQTRAQNCKRSLRIISRLSLSINCIYKADNCNYDHWFNIYITEILFHRRDCITYQCALTIRHVPLSLKRESIQFIESVDKSISYYAPHGISIYNHGVDLYLPKYETSPV